jgi:hypothetical protein
MSGVVVRNVIGGPLAGEPARDAQRHGHDRQGGVGAAGGGEDAAVGDVDVVHLVHAPVGVDDAGRRVHAHLHAAHRVFAGRRGDAAQRGRHRLWDGGEQLRAGRPAHRGEQRHEEVLRDLLEFADLIGDSGRGLAVDVLDRGVEGDVVGQVGHVGSETVDAGEPVAQQRGAHQLLERAAEKLHPG